MRPKKEFSIPPPTPEPPSPSALAPPRATLPISTQPTIVAEGPALLPVTKFWPP